MRKYFYRLMKIETHPDGRTEKKEMEKWVLGEFKNHAEAIEKAERIARGNSRVSRATIRVCEVTCEEVVFGALPEEKSPPDKKRKKPINRVLNFLKSLKFRL